MKIFSGLRMFRGVLPVLMAASACGVSSVSAAPPKVLGDYLLENVEIRGEVVAILPPKEIQKYLDRVQEAARNKPEWYAEYEKEAKPGIPLPFHENLGLTKEEYADYLTLWDQREIKPVRNGQVTLRLESKEKGEWRIHADGLAFPVALLRYDPAKDVMKSPNGTLSRLPDIATSEKNLLGKWTGHEWKYEESTALSSLKENLAIGAREGREFGIIIYRIKEVSSTGTLLLDKRMVIRFPLPKGG